MCGINGFITKKDLSVQALQKRLKNMNTSIIHRGPDEDGFFVEKQDGFAVGMAMRRLSIIDLSTGKQPIYSEDGNKVIVFNGEIYNYQILRTQLLNEGVKFHTTSDTEVILRLFEKDGTSSFSKLDGMFAFSIFDLEKNKIYIARDFFGEKPLYYKSCDNEIVWCSELKSLLGSFDKKPKINKLGLNSYLRLSYIPAPLTIYEGVKKLEASHFLEIDVETHKLEIKKILSMNPQVKQNVSFAQAKKEVKEKVIESVKSRSISDVPLGTFLSGGVDSSIVSYCLATDNDSPINTFSIGFKKKSYDETEKSKLVAKQIKSNHHEFIIDEDSLSENIHEIITNFDEPFADSAALPTYLVAKKTREHVTVALTGDGGDEVFGGYNKYYVGKMNRQFKSIVPRNLHSGLLGVSGILLKTKDDNRGLRFKIRKLLNSIDYEGDFYWNIISLANNQEGLEELLEPKWIVPDIFKGYKEKVKIFKSGSLDEFRAIDYYVSLEGCMLPKVDRTSMLVSLECRAPFLNKTLWDYTMSLPEEFLMKGWNKKYILKEAFKDVFPDDFLEKSKKGFGVPVGDWLRQGLKSELESYIDKKYLKEQDIFRVEPTIKLVSNHIKGKADNTFRVWNFYCFQKWYNYTYKNIKVEENITSCV